MTAPAASPMAVPMRAVDTTDRLDGEEVTQCAIDALVARRRADGSRAPLVAVLWGKDAQSLAPRLGDTPIIASPHPSPLSAYRGFFGSRPFSRANRLLEEQGASGVDWSLGR